MVPSYIIILEKFPLSQSGKINKRALPEIIYDNKNIVKPSTKLENELHNIICKLINLNTISVTDNFFDLGMDSLLAIRLSLEIYELYSKNLNITDLYKYNTIQLLANYLDTLEDNSQLLEIKKYPEEPNYELSSAQKRIYYATKLSGEISLLYNVSGGLLIHTRLDKDKVQNIFNILIKENSIFRTYFKLENNVPKQFVAKNVTLNISTFEHDASEKVSIKKLINDFPKFFDFDFVPLLRVELHYIGNSSLILIDTHHIIMDGTSFNIFINKFCNLYNEIYDDEPTIEYKDFSIAENNFIGSDKLEPLRDYWSKRYENFEIPVINLPYDFSKSDAKTFKGEKVYYHFEKSLMDKVNKLANSLNVSSYMLFLSCLYLLLYKYTGQETLVVGSPTEARNNAKLRNLIGNFVNNIALNIDINPELSFENLICQVKESVLGALSNSTYPYDLLVKDLKIPSNVSLFDVVLTYQNEVDYSKLSIDGNKVEVIPANNGTSKFDLTFEVEPSTCNLNIEYNSDLFKINTIDSLFEHYIHILDTVSENLSVPVKDIDIATTKEKMLLSIFNGTDDVINDDTVVSLFEEQVKLNPDNIAVICDDKSLTYSELNKKANSLAHLLIERGIHTNDIVCVMTNRSMETIICMLGILKAGAAFLNLDPTYPTERTQYYISNAKAQYVLTQRCLKDTVKEFENCIEIDLDNDFYNYNFKNPNVAVEPNDLSYIIYTSGSTGTPKGAMLNQVGFANMTKAMTKVLEYLKDGNKHCLVSVTSTPFDIFVYEIIVSLTHGLKVLMANNAEHRNPILLDALIKKYNADVMTVTPSLMKINYDNRIEPSALSNIKHMVFGGEPLPEKFVNDLRKLSEGVTIYNIYGPCEITILSNVQKLNDGDEITIGPPIMNTQIHILDKYGNRVPIGVVGEIYISGIQVGLGYLNKPELTKEKYLPNKFGPGRMYKSGDIGRWTFDGKVQCLGRIDNQIKLRGLRIELGEIEEKMESIEGVISSVVNKVVHDEKEYLCGYYVTDKNASVSEQFVKDFLRKSLPHYMVPTYIVHLDQMPYSINRKIDRQALPLPNFNCNTLKDIVNNQVLTDEEEKLLEIWKKILNLDNISITDNFFDIGGDSISAINMQLEAMKYGFTFEYADIFNHPTIQMLAIKNNTQQDTKTYSISDFDYTKINEVLKQNDVSNISTIKKYDVNNVFLIGGTGYLGSHIINSFLENETGDIYCLVRNKDNAIPEERLKNLLNFYFGDNYYENNTNRIHILEGDIVESNLGLSPENIQLLSQNVSTIINSGALVKHYGQKELFEDINVVGTRNVVELCKSLNKRLIHISTISVSGNGEKENSVRETNENINSKKIFTEKDLYVGQNLTGVYSTTKFRAEKIVLEEIANSNLNAQIVRMGNIVNRYSDGVFQRNTKENAFALRIQSFIKIGAFPEYSLNHAIELTPVDLSSNAIIKILQHDSNCNTFHLYNTNLMDIKYFYEILKNDLKIDIKPVSNEMMASIIDELLNDPNKKEFLSGIIQDIDADRNLLYTSNIKLDATFSEKYLKAIGFSWKAIDKDYIIKYINYFRKINFLD
jgi:amino acid adenylation domain-containing protein/thioester reductase-like protein